MRTAKPLSRREFLGDAARAGAAAAVAPLLGPAALAQEAPPPGLVVVRNGAAAALTRRAVEALGGMRRFVNRGDVVVVKPNLVFARKPELAVSTHPDVVAEVVRLALDAGAKRVRVFDRSVDNPQQCAELSGVKQAVEAAGGEFSFVNDARFVKTAIEGGEVLREWEIYRDALEADCLINVPIAKHHQLARLTLCLKNWMGLIGGNRGKFHGRQLAAKVADIHRILRPRAKLHVLDANRILLRNGPSGGNLEDVRETRTVVASPDPIAGEAWATSLFDLKPDDIDTVVIGARAGFGEKDLARVKVETIEAGG